ncbi:hypothetical protein [Actinomadura soli]|nr:hypothetical protein [Actinomadura soli]
MPSAKEWVLLDAKTPKELAAKMAKANGSLAPNGTSGPAGVRWS